MTEFCCIFNFSNDEILVSFYLTDSSPAILKEAASLSAHIFIIVKILLGNKRNFLVRDEKRGCTVHFFFNI